MPSGRFLETVRATAARIGVLQASAGPGHDTSEALARETAALTQAIENARGILAKAAELAARRDGQESAGAKMLAEGAAALKTHGEALDKPLCAAGQQAEADDDVEGMKRAGVGAEQQSAHRRLAQGRGGRGKPPRCATGT